ncbi:probable amino acid permease 7 [Hibiscus syriacus]|uniref:probable amino acid permease 7 n=1 Tax=Hibiscus syriacus TaxID=106335 RepID=UPI00192355CD|nr:probable amino acid permease 7 [Hibiscus syriacus]
MVHEVGEDSQSPLLGSSSSTDQVSAQHVNRTGSVWAAIAHIISGVIGAAVLSLAWSIAQLGWIAGPVSMLAFAAITTLSTYLLCDCYMFHHPQHGPIRVHSYMDAVLLYLGEKKHKVCGVIAQESLYGITVAHDITSATSIKAIQKSNCYHREGHDAPCSYGDTYFMLLFGAVQVVMSHIPNFHNMAWLSVVAAIMSFTYSFIGFGLGFAQVIENGTIKGSITGVPAASVADKLWLVFQSLGEIAFAYPYTIILLEIQDTLKSPPSENKTMKMASMIAIFVTTFFYLFRDCFGYAAFGNNTPGNLLTGFGFFEPCWLIDFANACIVLHLVGGY